MQETGRVLATNTTGVFKRTNENGEIIYYITYKHNGKKYTEKVGA